jgi:hypothetical protein
MELTIYFEGNAFISYQISNKCVKSINLEKGQITVYPDEGSCLKQTFMDFPPKRTMFGLTSRGEDDSLKTYSMKMKLGEKEGIDIITLTIIADNISAEIS